MQEEPELPLRVIECRWDGNVDPDRLLSAFNPKLVPLPQPKN